MKDMILDRLNKMEDLEQRKLLKQIMTGLFMSLTEHQDAVNRQLEERVFREVAHTEEQFNVFVSLCHRDELDPIDEFLHPMLPEDAIAGHPDATARCSPLANADKIVLQTIYMQCGWDPLQSLKREWRSFHGELHTSEGSFGITVRLEPNTSYIKEIEKLYGLFQTNGIPWRTINHPYVYKFFDVIGIDFEVPLHEELEIKGVSIDLEEYESFKKTDWIPLWNIEKLSLKSLGFPIPATDKINYEHVVSLRKSGRDHGYLVDAEEEVIRYIKREPQQLTIVSPREKSGNWIVWKLSQPTATRSFELFPQILSNRRKPNFIGTYIQQHAAVVLSPADIARIVYSFEAAEGLELERVELRPGTDRTASQTYNMNPFIIDSLREARDKKFLRLIFRGKDDNLGNLDLVSFLVSEVQRVIADCIIEGEVL